MKKIQYDNPIGAQIELTGKCNLKCHHCYNSSGEAGKLDITDGDWLNFFDELTNHYSLPSINITGGEPLLRKELLLKILEIFSAKQPSSKIRILTNGYFLDEDFLSRLNHIKNEIAFQISLDGADKLEHQIVRRVRYSWEKALSACLLVVNCGYKLQMASTVSTFNYNQMERLFKLAILLGAESLAIGAILPLGRSFKDEKGLVLGNDKRVTMLQELDSLKEKYSSFIDVRLAGTIEKTYENYSNVVQDWLIVDHGGDVKIDTRLPYVVGNILNQSISENWKLVQKKYASPYVLEQIQLALEGNKVISNIHKVEI